MLCSDSGQHILKLNHPHFSQLVRADLRNWSAGAQVKSSLSWSASLCRSAGTTSADNDLDRGGLFFLSCSQCPGSSACTDLVRGVGGRWVGGGMRCEAFRLVPPSQPRSKVLKVSVFFFFFSLSALFLCPGPLSLESRLTAAGFPRLCLGQ